MKCLVLAAVIIAVAMPTQSKPQVFGGVPYGGYQGGRGYGGSAYNGANGGYIDRGYGQNGLSTGHNIGHVQNDYDAQVHSHTSAGQNIGGLTSIGAGGHNNQGYGGYGRGQNYYGNGYSNGYGLGLGLGLG